MKLLFSRHFYITSTNSRDTCIIALPWLWCLAWFAFENNVSDWPLRDITSAPSCERHLCGPPKGAATEPADPSETSETLRVMTRLTADTRLPLLSYFVFDPSNPPTHGPLRASDPTPMGDDAVMGLKMRRLCIRVHPLSRGTHWETLDTNMEIEWVTVWGVRESPEDFRNASSTLLHRSLRSHSSSSRQLELLSFSNPSLLILFLLFSMSPLTLPLSIWREVLCERGIVTINDSNNFLLKFLTRLFFRKGC